MTSSFPVFSLGSEFGGPGSSLGGGVGDIREFVRPAGLPANRFVSREQTKRPVIGKSEARGFVRMWSSQSEH